MFDATSSCAVLAWWLLLLERGAAETYDREA